MTDALSDVLRSAAEERAAPVRLPSAEAITHSGRQRRRRRTVLPVLACAGVATAVAVGVPALRGPDEPSRLAGQGGATPAPSLAPGEVYVRALQACYEQRGMTVRQQADGTWTLQVGGAGRAALKEVAVTCRTSLAGLERAHPAVREHQEDLAELACQSVGGFVVTIEIGPRTRAETEALKALDPRDPPFSVAYMQYDVDEPPGSSDADAGGLQEACRTIYGLQDPDPQR